jgi:hypothetical protein
VPCSEGTRTDILDRVLRWIDVQDMLRRGDLVLKKESDKANAAAEDTCIFWINGSAGTGKTTIAYTIARDCRTHGMLGAGFFCSRDDADCSNPGLTVKWCINLAKDFEPLATSQQKQSCSNKWAPNY